MDAVLIGLVLLTVIFGPGIIRRQLEASKERRLMEEEARKSEELLQSNGH